MGTWNSKPFGNDTAKDWLWKLEKATDDKLLSATIKLPPSGALDVTFCEEALAAASIIYASRLEPVKGVPKIAKDWINHNGYVSSTKLV